MSDKIKLILPLLSVMTFFCGRAENESENTLTDSLSVDTVLKYELNDQQQFDAIVERCRRMSYRISAIHNQLIDLTYVSHGVETAMTDSMRQYNMALDEAVVKLDSIQTDDRRLKEDIKRAKVSIADDKHHLKTCAGMLKKKKSKR